MTDLPTCPLCGRPIHDQAYIDRDCARRVDEALALVIVVAGEVTNTVAKLDRVNRIGGHEDEATEPAPADSRPGPAWLRSTEHDSALNPTPMPVNLSAGRRHNQAAMELLNAARRIENERGRTMPTTPHCAHNTCRAVVQRLIVGPPCAWAGAHPLVDVAAFLRTQLDWLRHRQNAADELGAIQDAAQTIVAIVDRPADQWFAGLCSCGEKLWPNAGAKTIRCHCGAEHDANERRAAMLEQLEEVWLGPDQCAHALTMLGVPTNASTIRTWGAQRHLLAPHPESLPGRPRYRVGSVRELAEQAHQAQKERSLKAAVKAAEAAERKAKKERVNA